MEQLAWRQFDPTGRQYAAAHSYKLIQIHGGLPVIGTHTANVFEFIAGTNCAEISFDAGYDRFAGLQFLLVAFHQIVRGCAHA